MFSLMFGHSRDQEQHTHSLFISASYSSLNIRTACVYLQWTIIIIRTERACHRTWCSALPN